MMKEPSGLRRVDIVNPSNLNIASIPVALAGEGFELAVHGTAYVARRPAQWLPRNTLQSPLMSLVLSLDESEIPWDTNIDLSGVISTSANLRVFACNSPFDIVVISTQPARIPLPMHVVTALTTRMHLVSLSLNHWTTSHDQFVGSLPGIYLINWAELISQAQAVMRGSTNSLSPLRPNGRGPNRYRTLSIVARVYEITQ
jgi:hypothetical protein